MRHGGAGDMEGLAKRQIVSRFEGMRELSDKAQTERALALCRLVGMPGYGPGAGSFFPRTWLLPEQRAELEEHVRERRLRAAAKGRLAPTVIVKPSGGSEGNGIFLVQHESKLPCAGGHVASKPYVAQTYLSPLLMDGKKFDLRLYVLVRSVDPLEVYLHREGLARFCTEDYAAPTAENLGRAYAHLTNYSLNKRSENYVHLDAADVDAADAGAAGGGRDRGARRGGRDRERRDALGAARSADRAHVPQPPAGARAQVPRALPEAAARGPRGRRRT